MSDTGTVTTSSFVSSCPLLICVFITISVVGREWRKMKRILLSGVMRFQEGQHMNRRRFVGTAAMTVAASQFGMLGTADAKDDVPRELAAIGRATQWLNSPRPAPSDLLGKVVVVNFCTYTCINWLRTLPHVRAWAE